MYGKSPLGIETSVHRGLLQFLNHLPLASWFLVQRVRAKATQRNQVEGYMKTTPSHAIPRSTEQLRLALWIERTTLCNTRHKCLSQLRHNGVVKVERVETV